MRRSLAFLAFSLATAAVVMGSASALDCGLKPGTTASASHAGLCSFDPVERRFRGSPAEQASCLLHTVKEGGNREGWTFRANWLT